MRSLSVCESVENAQLSDETCVLAGNLQWDVGHVRTRVVERGINLTLIIHLSVGLITCICMAFRHTARDCGVNTQNNVSERLAQESHSGKASQ